MPVARRLPRIVSVLAWKEVIYMIQRLILAATVVYNLSCKVDLVAVPP